MSAHKEFFVNGPARLSKGDAQIIGPVLQELADAGPVTAREVLDRAHSANSPLHSYFEWDDQKAADSYRVDRAKDIIRSIRVRVVSSDGVGRGLAAQRVSVRPVKLAAPSALRNVSVREAVEPAHKEEWERRALDRRYYPETLEDAHSLIDLLRERLIAMIEDPDMSGREFGMTGSEAVIYRFLRAKNGGVATKEAIFAALYGGDEDAPDKKVIDVLICKLRAKMPSSERIETVWGVGYALVTESGSVKTSAPSSAPQVAPAPAKARPASASAPVIPKQPVSVTMAAPAPKPQSPKQATLAPGESFIRKLTREELMRGKA